jgi:hypothetical protein
MNNPRSLCDLEPITWPHYSLGVDLTSIPSGTELYIDGIIMSAGGESNSWDFHRLNWKRQHDIWEHGNQLLSKPNPSQQDLDAAIIQFQRAVELRDTLLDQIYRFEKIPGRTNTNKYAVMADLGIIRPTLKIRLRDLRNSLIHEPGEIQISKNECELLSDTAWYYLKVTDRITQQCASEVWIDYSSKKTGRTFLALTFETVSWSIKTKGNLSPKHLLSQPAPGCLIVRVDQSEFVKYSGDLKIVGEATGTDTALWSLVQIFFDESVL